MQWLGCDIGGANLKLAAANGFASVMPFRLWEHPDRLAHALDQMLRHAPEFCGLALTMTGEMADCYETREEGVCRILDQVTCVVPAGLVRVYLTSGEWTTASQAARRSWMAASSNWHALAQYCVRFTKNNPGILVDIGSTTTDIIPIKRKVATKAKSDRQRMEAQQLIYSGVERTPICALLREVTLGDRTCPIMAEFFATTLDAYLWLEKLPADPDCGDTCDQRPRTRRCAKFRLARLIGEDGSTILDSEVDQIAQSVLERQAEHMAKAVEVQRANLSVSKVLQVVLTGHGDFLWEAVCEKLTFPFETIRMSELPGAECSRCATAYALAVLADEQLPVDTLSPIARANYEI